MNHWRRVALALGQRRGVRASLLILVLMCGLGLFADLIAADGPILAVSRSRVDVLACSRARDRYASLSRDAIDDAHRGQFVIWPLLRQGPDRATDRLASPSRLHPLGTDEAGHDILASVVHGARTSLGPALVATLLSLILGALLGGLAGVLGGTWDELVARPIEIVESFPTVAAVALAMAVAPSRSGLTLALGFAAVRWAEVARVVRIETLRLMGADPIAAARALGASPWHIVRRHVLPHAAGSLVVLAIAPLPTLVLLEASVAFLGIGLPHSWGARIAAGLQPGGSMTGWAACSAALMLTVAASKVLADALAEALDPRAPRLHTAPAGEPKSPTE